MRCWRAWTKRGCSFQRIVSLTDHTRHPHPSYIISNKHGQKKFRINIYYTQITNKTQQMEWFFFNKIKRKKNHMCRSSIHIHKCAWKTTSKSTAEDSFFCCWLEYFYFRIKRKKKSGRIIAPKTIQYYINSVPFFFPGTGTFMSNTLQRQEPKQKKNARN